MTDISNTEFDYLNEVDELCSMTASEVAARFLNESLSISEYLDALIAQIEKAEPNVQAWQHLNYDQLRNYQDSLASNFDNYRQNPRALPLYGIPFGIKDIFNTEDMPTEHGSCLFSGYNPGNDARVVTDMKRAGGVPLGKTVTAELTVHRAGKTRNPLDLSRSCGTSSSGSAAAVAAYMVPIALSSQTASSTIRPASYCGIYGFKPSFGLLPRTAMLKTTDSLDTVGMMARSVADLKLMFEVMRVRGENYPIVEREINLSKRRLPRSSKWKIGVLEGPKSYLEDDHAKDGINKISQILSDAGCEIVNFKLPNLFDEAHQIHSKIYNKCLAYYFKTEWNSRKADFSDIMSQMIENGIKVGKEEYVEALTSQTKLAESLGRQIGNVDVIICPSAASEAPLGMHSVDVEDHTLIWTMCYLACLSVPILSGGNGLPIGVQVVAPRFNDYIALDFAEYLTGLMKK